MTSVFSNAGIGQAKTSPTPASRGASNSISQLSDLGNMERLVREHGDEIRFCKSKGWMVFEGRRWKRDDKGHIHQLAANTARRLLEDAGQIADPDLRKLHADHAARSQAARALRAMVEIAQSHPLVAVASTDFDTDPWLLNVLNGTVDLRTGDFRKHRPSDLITKLCPVEYDRRAYSPLWLRFLERVQPDPEVRAFLQRLVGYALTGVIREHVLPINYGGGRNGKSVFVETVLHILGDYARTVPTELLLVKRGDAHPTERATLLGCRFAAAAETEEGRALNVALVKQLTGGDRISARFMRGDFFEFPPTHKLMLSTNHRPVIRETKNAIWDRVHLIPWAVTIPEAEQDKELTRKLKDEAAGILRWAVEGCLEWQRQGLNPPEAIKAATAEYREGQDFIATFLDECCEVEPEARESASKLYEAYHTWALACGETPQSRMAFAERLGERGFKKHRPGGVYKYKGLRLRPTEAETTD